MSLNITPDEVLEKINTNLAYNFYKEDFGFDMLTSTRYRDIKSIPAAYFCTLDGTKLFKIVCEEVTVDDLPEEEKGNLEETKENYQDELNDEDEDDE